jgi:malate/lactate dehydrogenase
MIEQSVGVLGVGRLGSDVAFTLAEQDLCDIVLYDKDPERAEYLASDLSDTLFGHAYNRRVSWVHDVRGLAGCSVILVAAGTRRDTGISTAELFRQNRSIAAEMADAFIGSSNLFVMASEPVDLMTAELARALRLPSSRVMGIGGIVDAHRVRHALGEALSVRPGYIRSHVIGPHDSEVSIIWDYTSINGVSIRDIAKPELLGEVERALASDVRLTEMNVSTSRYTAAIACLELLRSLVKDDRRILSVTVPWHNLLGISDVAMSVPAVIGRFGAERAVPPKLDGPARDRLERIAGSLASALSGDA